MANLRLKKTILEVVDNQLRANDPPCTKNTYEKLLDAGYSKSEAKEKIGAVVLTEIYDILKKGKAFDEEKYKCALEEMLEQSIDYEDVHHIETEWDKWDDLVQKGYNCFEAREEEQGLAYWKDAWSLILSVVAQTSETYAVYELMDEQDYVYPIDEWLRDYEEELGNALKHGERMKFCQKVLDVFDWEHDDDSCFRCGIGESLFGEGKTAEAFAYYENWLANEPKNLSAIDSFSWILSENGDTEKAYEVIRNVTWNVSCELLNEFLFMRAQQLADYIGKKEESRWYQQQLDTFQDSIREWEKGNWKQVPTVKEKKIYPNDPCPCGSGKKYKKCCGK